MESLKGQTEESGRSMLGNRESHKVTEEWMI